ACRDGGIVLFCFLPRVQSLSRFATAPFTQGSLPLRRELCIAKAFENHRHRWWFSKYNKKRSVGGVRKQRSPTDFYLREKRIFFYKNNDEDNAQGSSHNL
ncbi:MAG: hypothetical protein IKA76_04750, partial [Clostridia bacterium]|nr:hypothetical protein [Clostridia bacterium]